MPFVRRFPAATLCLIACGGPLVDPDSALPSEVPQPVTNPATPAKVALGRALFWDPILSGDKDVACATCHHPDFAYADGLDRSIGVKGAGLGPRRQPLPGGEPHRTPRNSMTVLNAAYNGAGAMFWDSRARSLEDQARGPIAALDEMRGTAFAEHEIFPEVAARLRAIPEYAAAFTEAFGSEQIDEDRIVAAIASFERTIVDRDSSYDRFARGDRAALSAAAQRGLQIFNQAGCPNCHSGAMFSDFQLHRLGVPDVPGLAHDPGNGAERFRTGSLRNVTRTGPYMHNGALATLDDVFRFYDRVDRRLDPQLRGLDAPEGRANVADVKAFLESLSDGTFDRSVPDRVPSGLSVGGNVR